MEQQQQLLLLDKLLLGVVTDLQSHHHQLFNINASLSAMCSKSDICSWEFQHKETLPDDLKGFLSLCNGFEITYEGKNGLVIGCLSINSLERLQVVKKGNLTSSFVVLYSEPTLGRILLCLKDQSVSIESLNNKCYRIAASFSNYLRLLIANLGVEGWQNAFTPNGLHPCTKQWMHLLVPDRMEEDCRRSNNPNKNLL